jgi:CRISPR-associated protein Cmr6
MMLKMLPLPRGLNGSLRAFAASGNQGLRFNKFVDGWGFQKDKYELLDETTGKKRSGKQIWIENFSGKTVGNSVELNHAAQRLAALAAAQSGGSPLGPLTLKSVSRFVTGLGYDHATENGFVWHHTLGVPYFPASGIKGMMRAFADHWQALGGAGDVNSATWFTRIVELFGNYGPKTKDEPQRGISDDQRNPTMGRLIVFDALPTVPVKLAAEILTPHDGGWRLNGPVPMKDAGGRNLVPETQVSPGDWHNPVPIPFLAVETDNEFQFALGLTRHGTPDDLQEGYILLEAALQWMGIGAKTASGFGRFERVRLEFTKGAHVLVAAASTKKNAGKIAHIIGDGPITDKRMWKIQGGPKSEPGGAVEMVAEADLTLINETELDSGGQ